MLEGKRVWILGTLLVIVGAALLFITALSSVEVSHGDPVPGFHNQVGVELGVIGMVATAIGLGSLMIDARKRGADSKEGRMTFLSIAAFFVLSLIILFTVFNPLISPYDTIRDSDLDGYTDDIDAYPHDQSRHYAPFIQLTVAWANTTTNYSAIVTNVGYIVYEDPIPLSRIVLAVRLYSASYFAYNEDIGTLEELDGVWIDGASYTDNAPFNELTADDVFSFDKEEFYMAFEPMLMDDKGHQIAVFTTF
jgi:hypothetical protein